MADVANFVIPKPPDNPDLNALHTYIKDLYSFLLTNWQAGVQLPFFSQNQVNQMTSLTQAGKVFFNNDTGKAMIGEVNSGSLTIKTITTS